MKERRAWLQMALAAMAGPFSATLAAQVEVPAGGRLPRIGLLSFGRPPGPDTVLRGFSQGMRELGYVEGRNVVVDARYADGHPERLAPLAADIVQAKPDVILTGGPGPFAAIRRATSTIPIVNVGGNDPVGEGWAQSLAQPGGQATGLMVTFPEIDTKRLELVKEALPGISMIAVLLSPVEYGTHKQSMVDRLEAAARRLGVRLQWLEVGQPADFATVLARARENHAQAVMAIETAFVVGNRGRLVDAAARERLPVAAEFAFLGTDGLLMAYGADINELLRRAASHVHRILKGARPGAIPIELPTKIDLTVNLKTARTLGLTIPPAFLLRADRVVE